MLEDDVVFCRERVCPCDPSMPDLCEVEIKVGIFIPIVIFMKFQRHSHTGMQCMAPFA